MRALGLAILLIATPVLAEAPMTRASHPYVGLWVTEDGHVRHELRPENRYVEARGTREGAYRGRYEVRGTHIDYWDDTGFTADGTFVDADTLHHGGMVLRRRPNDGPTPKAPEPVRRGPDETAWPARIPASPQRRSQ